MIVNARPRRSQIGGRRNKTPKERPRLRGGVEIPLVLLLIMCSQFSCGRDYRPAAGQGTMSMQVLDENSNGREFTLARGQTFQIRLEENPTTGYRWQIVAGAAPTCTLVGDSYEAAAGRALGRPGSHSWTFRVQQAGKAAIELIMQRSWESSTPPVKTYRVTVTATD